MATRLRLRALADSEPMPNAKQSADAINRDVATSIATYANPAKMLTDIGSGTSENSSTVAEPGAAHYTHYGSWISKALVAQTVSGTVTIALVMAEGNALANANPRIKIYKWLANDTFGSDLLALVTSGTEIPAAFPAAPVTYFNAVAITSTGFALNDRIVIEIETYDNNTKTTAYLHGIRFDGADAGGYAGYVEFSAAITFSGTVQNLAGVTNGIANVTGITKVSRKLAGIVACIGTTAGLIKTTRRIAGLVSGVASTTGNLTVTAAGVFLAGVVSGIASVTGAIKCLRPIAGLSAGLASVSGGVKVTRRVFGAISGIASVTGLTKIARRLAGITSGGTSLAGNLSVLKIRLLAGLVSGIASVIGALRLERYKRLIFTDVLDSLAFTNVEDSLTFTNVGDSLKFTREVC